jgi:endoglucanase
VLGTRGTDWVDSQGNRVVLRGCNLGNWLVQEMWMHNMATDGIPDQYTMEQVLTRRFGKATNDKLMDIYRANYITARDFQIIKSFGMNVVRLPILYTLLENEDHPFQLKPDAWVHIDRAIALAEAQGIYVILDLHGAPGGQNPWQHCGRENQNALWGSEQLLAAGRDTPAAGAQAGAARPNPPGRAAQSKRRTVWLWQQMASRYRGRSTVAGYDLLNEPYTAPKTELKELMLDIYRAIRQVDPDHIIIFPSLPDGFEFYGKPKELGLTNVAFSAHFYPGFFGWGEPDRQVHTEWLTHGVPEWRKRVAASGVPLLVGEMNVVLRTAGGAEMMRRSFDAYTSSGWAVTMWSYKVLTREGGTGDGSWGMVTNPPASPRAGPPGEGAPLAKVGTSSPKPGVPEFTLSEAEGPTGAQVDLNTSSAEQIEAYFRSLSKMHYLVYEELRHALTAP